VVFPSDDACAVVGIIETDKAKTNIAQITNANAFLSV